jgi:hypothetical protein
MDFHRPAPERATVATYVYKEVWDALEVIQDTTRLRWELVVRNDQWQINHLAQTSW